MLQQDGNGRTVDPENSAALVEWRQRRSAKERELSGARSTAAGLQAVLARPDVIAAKAERLSAGEAFGQEQGRATEAQQRYDGAVGEAARYEANEVAAAEDALDQATLALSQALAELLRTTSTSVSLTATVDGLALRERYRVATAGQPPRWGYTTIPFPAQPSDIVDPELDLPQVDGADGSPYGQLLAVLDRLDERVDAVTDLVTAESVHQLVAGNVARAGGSLAVAAEGRVPDEFDVIATPRPGHDVTHRVMVLLDPARAPSWTVPAPGPAARLDPVTAAWVARLLPNPALVGVVVRWVGADGTESDLPVEVAASALGVDALGWVRLAANPAELAERLVRAAGDKWRAAHQRTPRGRAVWDVDTSWAPPMLPFADLLAAAAAAGRVLASARALEPADLAHPAAAEPAVSGAAVTALAGRVQALEQEIDALGADLEAAMTADPQDPARLLALLLSAAAVGVAEAIPPADTAAAGAAELDPTLLSTLARAAAARLRLRHAAAPFTADPADPAAALRRARARADELCGMRLPLPVDLPRPGDATVVADLAAGATRLAGADPAAVRGWLLDHARVRPAVRALTDALTLAEALGGAESLRPRVAQLPVRTEDLWAGATPAPQQGTVTMVVQEGYGNTLPASVTGLVLDTWTQPVPAAAHESAVAFHHDQPDATAPQALLLAVHPDPGADGRPATWDLDTLLEVLTSTLALARDRATAAELSTVRGVEVEDV